MKTKKQSFPEQIKEKQSKFGSQILDASDPEQALKIHSLMGTLQLWYWCDGEYCGGYCGDVGDGE